MRRSSRVTRTMVAGDGISDLLVDKHEGVLYLHSQARGKCFAIPILRLVTVDKDGESAIEFDTGTTGDDSIYYNISFSSSAIRNAAYTEIMETLTGKRLPS